MQAHTFCIITKDMTMLYLLSIFEDVLLFVGICDMRVCALIVTLLISWVTNHYNCKKLFSLANGSAKYTFKHAMIQ